MTHEEFIRDYLYDIKHHFENGILHVDERLDIRGTNITTLPENIIFHYGVDLEYSKIKTLPDDLIFESYLDIHDTKIEKLPNNLTIDGNLLLQGTDITELPSTLIVGGALYLGDTCVTSLPNGVEIFSIAGGKKLKMSEEMQIKISSKSEFNFHHIKDPTEKAKTMHNLLWKL